MIGKPVRVVITLSKSVIQKEREMAKGKAVL
jgi:hypothetical protein